MGFPWFPAPGFTCQLWWIFSLYLRCSKLPGQRVRQERWREDEDEGEEGEEAEEEGKTEASLLSNGRINHRIIYLQAQSARAPAIHLPLPYIKARSPHVNNKSSLAFHLWAIKCHHISSNGERLYQVGRVARIPLQVGPHEKSPFFHLEFKKEGYHLLIWISKGDQRGGPSTVKRQTPLASTKQVCDDQLLRMQLWLLLVGGGRGGWGRVRVEMVVGGGGDIYPWWTYNVRERQRREERGERILFT